MQINGIISNLAGINSPRAVGRILHSNCDPVNIPCFKVVSRNGELSKNYAFGGAEKQREMLEKDGVLFIGDLVDMDKCLWNPFII